MRARDRLRLGAALAPELGPDAGEAEQRPIFLEREPDDVFLLRRRIWLGGVLGKTVRRHEAAVLRLLPAAQCGDDVLRMLVTGGPPVLGGGRHALAHQHHLFGGRDTANHRCRIVRKNAGHRRQIANVSVHAPEQTGNRCLVSGDRIEIMPTSA